MYPPQHCDDGFDQLERRYICFREAIARRPDTVAELSPIYLEALALQRDVITLRDKISAGDRRRSLNRWVKVLHTGANQLNTHIQKLELAQRAGPNEHDGT